MNTVQLPEVKSLSECQLLVLSNYGFKSWNEALRFWSASEVLKKTNEAALMYGDQFKSSPASTVKVISDEEIRDAAHYEYMQRHSGFTNEQRDLDQSMRLCREAFKKGAKWVREQLTGKS